MWQWVKLLSTSVCDYGALILDSHSSFQNVVMVCLEACKNLMKRRAPQCAEKYQSRVPYPLEATVLHYAQWSELGPDFPCEECLNAAREKWRIAYEKSMENWTTQQWSPRDPNAMEICM